MTEQTGFDSEPTYPLAEQAENQVLRERLYAAQNAVVRMEGERDGKVREALLSLAAEFDDLAALSGTLAPTYLLGMADAARMAREALERIMSAPAAAAACDRVPAERESRTDALSAAPLDPCTRCNGSGSEPDTDPDEAAGLVLVGRRDLRLILARGEFGHLTVENAREIGRQRREAEVRLIDAAGSGPSGHPTSPERDAERSVQTPGGPEAPGGFQGRDGLPQILAMLRSCANEEEATVTDNPRHEYDKGLFVAGMRRAIDLVEHGDQPAEAQPS